MSFDGDPPFFVVGGAVLALGGRKRVALDRQEAGPVVKQSLNVIGRFMTDL